MEADKYSRTAEYIAFYRAIESARPPKSRLFTDPLAFLFLRPSLRLALFFARFPLTRNIVYWLTDRSLPGSQASVLARTCLIDRYLTECMGDGIEQVVILGAGFDSRAWRLPGTRHASVFEVDHPATQKLKKEKLAGRTPPPKLVYAPIDFVHQKLPAVLEQNGFRQEKRTAFIWEGVTNYLNRAAVNEVLSYVARCGNGSRILFTFIDAAALDGSGTYPDGSACMRVVAEMGEPWTFGFAPARLQEDLREQGLKLKYFASARDYRPQYLGKRARREGFEFYHVAEARVERP